MKLLLSTTTTTLLLLGSTDAFTSLLSPSSSRTGAFELLAAKVGIFFGTSTGSTEEVADLIAAGLGDESEGPFDVDTLDGPIQDEFNKYDVLIVGTPTWNTGADTERSGTGWDEIYYGTMQDLQNLQGKKVAVFGLGDQVSYAENYADATGELHDIFEGLGCQMMGYTSQEGYEHEASKSIRGDKFCGLLCDMVNQEELSAGRVESWIAQLREEGLLSGTTGTSSGAPVAVVEEASIPATPTPPPGVNEPAAEPISSLTDLEEHSDLLQSTIQSHSNTGFKPHYNVKTKSTMWVSGDGRTCYYTKDKTAEKTEISP